MNTLMMNPASSFIMSGQSRESLAGFMLSAGKTVAILTVAGVVAGGSTTLYTNLTNGLEETITGLVTGKPSATAYTEIDDNLKLMQTGLGMMKAIDTGDNEAVESERTQALWMSGIGTAGPAIVAGTLLIINKFGMAIFIGFGPLFIMCLLFDQTKAMFQTWLKFGIGLMFSMAILVFMSNIAMRMVGALAATAFAQDFLGLGGTGFTAAAMQQGGLGLVLTALLVTVPAMATNFIGTAATGFIGSNMMGNYGSVPQAAGNTGGSPSSYNGGTPTVQNVPNTSSVPSDIAPNISTAPRVNTGFGTQSSSTPDYNAPRTESAMGVASGIGTDSSGINQARNASPATASGSSPSVDQQTQAYGASAAAAGNRTYAEIATNSSAGSQAAAFPTAGSGGNAGGGVGTSVASSSNAPAQSLTPQGGAPVATGGQGAGGSAATGARTASAGGDDFSQVRQGSQHPTRGG